MKRLALVTALGLVLAGAPNLFAQDANKGGNGAPAETTEARIARLVRELGDSSFEKRSAAQKELEQIGRPAVSALEKAAKSEDPEVSTRAMEALARIRGQVPSDERTPAPEEPEAPIMPPPLQPMPMPDMDELWKELEKQMPDDMGDLFRRLFRNGAEPNPDEQQQDPNQPRFRFQMRRLGPNGEWEVIEENGAGVPGLGMNVGPANAALRAQLGIETNEGVVVNQVLAGGLAERAGVKLYDVIVAVDGRPVRAARDLKPLLTGGCKVELYRRAQKQTLELRPQTGTQPAPQQPGQQGQPGTPPKQGRSF